MKTYILSNFQPIKVGKLINQVKLNQYTKFLYHYFQTHPIVIESNYNANNSDLSFEEVSLHVDKYAVGVDKIKERQVLIFEEVDDFIINEMSSTSPSEYVFPSGFEIVPGSHYGPKIELRMEWFKKKMRSVFDQFYAENFSKPKHIVHVSCSGYSSPSVAQEAVIKRDWSTVNVTHSYHMGCYGAFPAIRTARGLLCQSGKTGRVDIIHTELLSAHLNLTEFSPMNTMICSLFSDGFIGYSLYDEFTFHNDTSRKNDAGLKILASHEIIIPDSLEEMTRDLGDYSFLMTLSKRVPLFIKQHISEFMKTMCGKIGLDFEKEKDSMYFAIHPGGPKIINYVVNELNIEDEQAFWSYEVLKYNGNMSSATVPHVFEKIVNDSNIKEGAKIIAIAFGPGLTATGLILEKTL